MTDLTVNRIIGLAACLFIVATAHAAGEAKTEGNQGTVHVPAFDLPLSNYLSPEARQVLQRAPNEASAPCPSLSDPANLTVDAVKAVRACLAEREKPRLEKLRTQFPVVTEPETIAGVPTEIFTPKEGNSATNKHRVLINLHGGGFVVGDARGESIPIAALGKIKVVGVDYRMGPEHKFPAASEDVAAVYQALLKDYAPANIGIYGCSAGGRLTAQSMAWFQKVGLPRPGAIGVFGAGAASGVDGDSAHIGSAILRRDMIAAPHRQAYFGRNPNLKDPLMGPVSSPEGMSKFPPTLLISATRDYGLSNIVYTHAQLVKSGVPADLHVWEGLGHCFFGDPELPESHEAYEVIVKFFASHLGKAAR